MHKGVKQLNNLSMLTRELAIDLATLLITVVFAKTLDPLGILDILCNHVKNFHLIISCDFVTRRTFLDFKCHEGIIEFHIFCEPDRGELSPA